MSKPLETGRPSTGNETNATFAHKSVLKREFGQRLRQLLIQKQMSQTDLARAAARYTPDKQFGRDLVSSYISGRYLPNPLNLEALASALGVAPDDLIPNTDNLPRRGETTLPLDIRVLGDDHASLRINKVVSLSVAIQVIQLINDDAKKS